MRYGQAIYRFAKTRGGVARVEKRSEGQTAKRRDGGGGRVITEGEKADEAKKNQEKRRKNCIISQSLKNSVAARIKIVVQRRVPPRVRNSRKEKRNKSATSVPNVRKGKREELGKEDHLGR